MTQTDFFKNHPPKFYVYLVSYSETYRGMMKTNFLTTHPYLDEFTSDTVFVTLRNSRNTIFRQNALFWMNCPGIGLLLCTKILKLTIGWIFQSSNQNFGCPFTSTLCLQSFQLGFQVSLTVPFMWHHVTLKCRTMESRDPEGCNRIFRKWHANELN